ncbi:2-iminoacetate synthase [Ruminiclostridium sufflavum DSM 19573]|uniref:2-iminoacetate synthase n=1 Tax=Ruminiclostridium sufflavum DSM 19573 TaxID=1121337 RepID=A0A318Y079_9FIRM|nr:2-iminoacetate synthase ThiH [Ruminiclostridium sufflavum]PYG88734.1 2-iminoacetate synthase [Ruminiclostridium sufflavum DSM 19573]
MTSRESSIMHHLEGMEAIDSDIMSKVLNMAQKYDYNQYTVRDVEGALEREALSVEDFAAVLSPAAAAYLEQLAQKARLETRKHFGNSVSLFTPLYISNYCENNCVYCGFNCKNKIQRGKLSLEEIEDELKTIAKTGLKDILILTGEARRKCDVAYIGEAIKLARKYFSTISVEIFPLNTEEYRYIRQCGADFVCVYQETYNTETYEKMHPRGPKRVFPYRFNAQERAIKGGMRGVALGVLLGLDDFRRDAFAAGIHAYLLQQKYPHAELSFSVPRLRPYINNSRNNPRNVHESQLLQVILAYRLLMPFAGITISTRESPEFRDNVIGIAANKVSAGVKVSVGGHDSEAKGDEQFEISDPRDVAAIHQMILSRGLQPVYTDYVRV